MPASGFRVVQCAPLPPQELRRTHDSGAPPTQLVLRGESQRAAVMRELHFYQLQHWPVRDPPPRVVMDFRLGCLYSSGMVCHALICIYVIDHGSVVKISVLSVWSSSLCASGVTVRPSTYDRAHPRPVPVHRRRVLLLPSGDEAVRIRFHQETTRRWTVFFL